MHSLDVGNGYTFHFNSDFSGDIIITHPNKKEYKINGNALITFAQYTLTDKLIEYLENFGINK
jgi:hypothetical protein